jgi:hypothetical protein
VRRSEIEAVTRYDGGGRKKPERGSERVQILVLRVILSGIDRTSPTLYIGYQVAKPRDLHLEASLPL